MELHFGRFVKTTLKKPIWRSHMMKKMWACALVLCAIALFPAVVFSAEEETRVTVVYTGDLLGRLTPVRG